MTDPARLRSVVDPGYYRDVYADVAAAGADPGDHYAHFGHLEHRLPCHLFDPAWYGAEVGSVALAGRSPIEHYLDTGGVVDPHPAFDSVAYREQAAGSFLPDETPLEHYLRIGRAAGLNPCPAFDPAFYLGQYSDVAAAGLEPLEHYLGFGEREGRLANRTLVPTLVGASSPVRPVTAHGGWLGVFQRGLVDAGAPGVAFPIALEHLAGRAPVVFVSHDASRTGAPMILLELARAMARDHGVAPIVLLARGGDLVAEFETLGPTYVVQHHTDLEARSAELDGLAHALSLVGPSACVVNSAESRGLLPSLHRLDVPILSLVHEFGTLYEPGNWDEIAEYSDRVVFPAQCVADAARHALTRPLGTVDVDGQGLLRPSYLDLDPGVERRRLRDELGLAPDTPIVLGVGSMTGRKGTDLFVQIARQALAAHPDVVFVWAGGGPVRPDTHAFWLLDDVERLGDDRLRVLGEFDDPGHLFAGADVLLLTSRADPFPCVMHEAMATGTPIVAFEDSGGVTELVTHGRTGLLVPYLDVDAAARTVVDLVADPDHIERLGRAGRELIRSDYDFADYATRIHDRMIEEIRSRRGGSDQVRYQLSPSGQRTGRPAVVATFPDWGISGVCSVVEDLVAGLCDRGFDAYILFTTRAARTLPVHRRPRVPHRFLSLASDDVDERWERLGAYLNAAAPAIWLPNYDYVASALAPSIADDIGIVGVLHADDVEHYEHGYRLGRYWNRIVAVSDTVRQGMVEINPTFADRAVTIRNGIRPLDVAPAKIDDGVLRLAYSGRVIQRQKRIGDLIPLVEALDAAGTAYELTVIGDGPERPELEAALAGQIDAGRVQITGHVPRRRALELLAEADVFVLLSEFEGLPIALLEAMALECVPVVTAVRSGVPEVVTDGENGLLVPVAEPEAVAERLVELAADPARLRELGRAARRSMDERRLWFDDMVDAYEQVMHEVLVEIEQGWRRPEALTYQSAIGDVLPPPMLWPASAR